MANVLTPVKKFVRMNREDKASFLLLFGFLGFLLMLVLEIFKIIPENNIATELAFGGFIVPLGVGCLMWAHFAIKAKEKIARFMCGGAFSLFGLMCAECVIDFLVEHLTPFTLPQITAWYAIPCLIACLIGFIMVAVEGIKEAWAKA